MLFNIIIILLFVYGIYDGYRRGLVHEILRIVGFMFSLLFSLYYARDLSQAIFGHSSLINDQILSNSISFFILFMLSGIIVRIVISIVDKLTHIPVIHQINSIGGTVVGLVIAYLTILFILNVISVLPDNQITQQYEKSSIANFMVNKTPVLSHDLYEKWLR
ncbi:MAG: CvpA family protein [Apilactobacillus sp.]|uniref:CvpA family protein n=1 Tax=Apilactobacillus apinorum TaxID=1218495 RepID=UPI0030E8988C|nr:CvpA family protein [Apilactobacillus sp.]